MIHISLKSYLQKSGWNTLKLMFCDVIICPTGLYSFQLLKSKNTVEALEGFVRSNSYVNLLQ